MKKQKKNIKNFVVPKPWGSEYLIYENNKIAIWLLNIGYRKSTSFHCHAHKKTGLIVLDGVVQVYFLNGDKILKDEDLSHVTLHSGVFHSSKGLSSGFSSILEVESSKDKQDLIRMKDSYGRQSKPYESQELWTKRDKNSLWINDELGFSSKKNISGKTYEFSILRLTRELIDSLSDFDIIIPTKEDCVLPNSDYPVFQAGNVLNVETLKMF
jgi:uncharacterized cupin superfamily protein